MVSTTSRHAYELIGDFEVLIRRLVRWELRGVFGRQWLAELGQLAVVVDDNIRREAAADGFRDEGCSELSYLTLTELLSILKSRQYDFNRFLRPHQISRTDQSKVISVRNRVAHFRQSPVGDLQRAKSLDWIIESLRGYYSSGNFHSAELTDPAEVESQKEDNLSFLGRMAELGLSSIANAYSEYEQIGLDGFRTRLGVYDHHLYLDAYCETGFFDASQVLKWLKETKDRITLIKVGAVCQYLRFFVSVKFPDTLITRTLRGAVAVAAAGYRLDRSGMSLALESFEDAESDSLLVESSPTNICFSI